MTLNETVVHGVLHLCGHDHETDDGEMLALQAEILESLGRGALRPMSTPLRIRRPRRPPQRRQVDPGQRPGRPPRRDRLGAPADDPPGDPRRRHRPRGRTAAGPRRPARRAAPPRRADQTDAETGRARAGRLRRGAAGDQRRGGRRPRRPLHRRPAESGADRDPGDLRGQQVRQDRPPRHDRRAHRGGLAARRRRGLPDQRPRPARASRRSSTGSAS